MDDTLAPAARAWLGALSTGLVKAVGVGPDFKYVGPFGLSDGADLVGVADLATRIGLREIVIQDTLVGEGAVAIAYELETRVGRVRACDWIFLDEKGRIAEVNGYCSAAGLALIRRAESDEDSGGALW